MMVSPILPQHEDTVMPAKKLIEFLDQQKVKYVKISHSPAYTAQEVAAVAHVAGRELAKTVIVKLDGEPAMAVLPASFKVDFALLKKATKAKKVELAGEEEFRSLFIDCELGAMPPFGNLYDLKVYVAESLSEDSEIAFNACSHTELIRMSYADFQRLAEPIVVKFSKHV
jgi:Ala-tRNA(Pro) deacylase